MVNAILDSEEVIRIDDISPSYWLCLVRRSESLGSPFTVELISPSVRRLLLTQLWKWKVIDHIDMVVRFARISGGAGWSGVMSESLQQHLFSNKICVVAEQMFRTGSARSCWQPAFGDFSASPLLRKAREAVQPITITLDIRMLALRVYQHGERLTIQENIYYVPLSKNEVAIDSFIVHAGNLYLFQFASGAERSVNLGLVDRLAQFSGLPAAENQYLIFVIPNSRPEFKCPHSYDGFLGSHTTFVGRIDPLKFDSDFSTVDKIISQAALPVTHLL